eukprot:SAG31_NODE_5186_length_2693_cov_1.525443_1_plen_216_part_00
MTKGLQAEVSALIEQHLFASAVTVGQYMVASSGGLMHAPPSVLLLYAEALMGARDWRQAVEIFEQALLLGASRGIQNEADVRFKIGICLIEVGDLEAAQAALEEMDPRARTASIDATLARLYRLNGCTELAIQCYKNVLRRNPYAIEAAQALVDLRATEPPPVAESTAVLSEIPKTARGLVQGLSAAYTLVAQEAHSEALEAFELLERGFGVTVR